MTDSLLSKYLAKTLDDGNEAGLDEVSDVGAFGYLRGLRDRAQMLELRQKDGSIAAIAYAYVDQIEFDPATGITLQTGGQSVRIQGYNLNSPQPGGIRLFQGLTRHRITWVQAGEEAPDAVSISQITFSPRK